MSTNTAVRPAEAPAAKAWDIAATICDPEIPVLTIEDLGILRAVAVVPGEYDAAGTPAVEVTITPTYSGCPAMDTIRDDIVAALGRHGYADVRVKLVLAPAWTTDWMTGEGKAKLEQYGIAPPTGLAGVRTGPVRLGLSVKCPRCNSLNTREITRFGSTSCKALYQCNDCKEPFDYFKVL
ncbi:phenylacetate-CoA oxygenase subunit PaaJ [Arthrobacter sp. I2-34]|uniref:Phenylacetate-CoA oxygenase subunit PaaJ n=1 Tax=Arthrobacter hankyongi TaxID=2904801 RepID=A0ABS9L9W7_9MICC|nr:1,2-phenylacetyl-CoA epoxidase subunit PaaD [Arthrobacter hankyongi]MCG2623479.1 phenylacetate-CoA oxygenase subunit PaaJ [Arthrobacter hankyongi]